MKGTTGISRIFCLISGPFLACSLDMVTSPGDFQRSSGGATGTLVAGDSPKVIQRLIRCVRERNEMTLKYLKRCLLKSEILNAKRLHVSIQIQTLRYLFSSISVDCIVQACGRV